MSELLQALYDNHVTTADAHRWRAENESNSDIQKQAWLKMAGEEDAKAKVIWMQLEDPGAQLKVADSPSGLAAGGSPAQDPTPAPVVADGKVQNIPLSVTITSNSDWEEV